MADGGFYAYESAEAGNFMPHLGGYRDPNDSQGFGQEMKPSITGYYANQYHHVNSSSTAASTAQSMVASTAEMMMSSGMAGGFSGTPDEAVAPGAEHLLAKPVPMRRLSEKRIAQARANLNTIGHNMNSALLDPALGTSPAVAHALAATQQTQKRPRSEKKPIPDEQKDDKYFERRKRNNCAAKKSRDARKAREDEIAIRASFLEKENAILRAQVATLREEANSLRQLLLQKRSRP